MPKRCVSSGLIVALLTIALAAAADEKEPFSSGAIVTPTTRCAATVDDGRFQRDTVRPPNALLFPAYSSPSAAHPTDTSGKAASTADTTPPALPVSSSLRDHSSILGAGAVGSGSSISWPESAGTGSNPTC